MPHTIITRDDVPEGSFAYGQLASVKLFDCRADRFQVCTNCSTPINPEDNGRSGFRTILVSHFSFETMSEAVTCAKNLGNYEVTIVVPEGCEVDGSMSEPAGRCQ